MQNKFLAGQDLKKKPNKFENFTFFNFLENFFKIWYLSTYRACLWRHIHYNIFFFLLNKKCKITLSPAKVPETQINSGNSHFDFFLNFFSQQLKLIYLSHLVIASNLYKFFSSCLTNTEWISLSHFKQKNYN